MGLALALLHHQWSCAQTHPNSPWHQADGHPEAPEQKQNTIGPNTTDTENDGAHTCWPMWANPSQRQSTQPSTFSAVRIQKQTLHLQLDPEQRYVAGEVIYRLSLDAPADELYVDLDRALQVDSIWLSDQQPLSFRQDSLQLALAFPIPGGWPANQPFDLRIRYAGVPPVNPNGFGSFMTARHSADSIPVLWTLSQPYGCRDWWPAFQHLGVRADTTLLIVDIPIGYRAGGPGLLTRIDTIGQRVRYHWHHHYSMPPYLLGTAVSRYEVMEQMVPLSTTGDTVQVLNYVYTADTALAFPRLRDWLPDMLRLFSDWFGPYPFANEKYGHMQISIFSGGMEHNTMSSMGSWGYDLMAHELAHQWFGNTVTCGSWQDIWLNEGFATWMVSLCFEDIHDNGYWFLPWKRGNLNSALRVPADTVYVTDTSLTQRIFRQRTTYHKAGFVLHQLRRQLGDSVLASGLRAYLQAPGIRFGFARTPQLQGFLEQACQCSLDGFFRRYIYESGYPRYQFRWTSDGGDLWVHTRQLDPEPATRPFAQRLFLRAYGGGDSLDLEVDFNGHARIDAFALAFTPDSLVFDPEADILAWPAEVLGGQPSGAQGGYSGFTAHFKANTLCIDRSIALRGLALAELFDPTGRLLGSHRLSDQSLYDEWVWPFTPSSGWYVLRLRAAPGASPSTLGLGWLESQFFSRLIPKAP